MFKACMKTYWKNIKYVFSILGILFLTILLTGSVLVTGTGKRIQYMTDEIKTVTNDTDLTFNRIRDSLIDETKEISPEEALDDIKNGNTEQRAKETFGEALAGTVSNYANYAGEILAIIGTTLIGLLIVFIVAVGVFVLGIFASHDIVFFFARYDIKNRNFFKVWLELVLKDLIILASFLIVLFCAIKIPVAGVIMLALYPLLFCYLSMLSTWLTAGENRPSYKEFVTFKNVMILFGSDIVIILISVLVAGLMVLITNWFVGIIIGIALLIMTALTVSLNASAYIFGELGVSD